ncbi:MAG: hypothetical protein CSA72_00310 [Rhodobacterales bacterium]|nr:MAG: hypothetical protein CSA72_00310 [Rhodobacterales bacterium]
MPMAQSAKMRRRHWGMVLSFVLIVVAPALVIGSYLYTRAADQYVSKVGFSVRAEKFSSGIDLLGGLGGLGGMTSNGAADTDILYEFIQSQQLVSAVDANMDLRGIFSKPTSDPVFAFNPDGTIEDLTRYWSRMVRIFYDSGAGLIELRVHAFTPEDAQAISQAIFEESSQMINRLSAISRSDATRYAQEDLELAKAQLKSAREAMTQFRATNQIVDPAAEIGVQTGLMAALEQQLSNALIEYDLLLKTGSRSDPRLAQAQQRVDAIRQRIVEERDKIGRSDDGSDYSEVVGEYERLLVDREFAEQAYLASRAAYDNARGEAQRQSRYLAAYVHPTLAERAEYPKRFSLFALSAVFLFLAWSIGILIYYSIKDRR